MLIEGKDSIATTKCPTKAPENSGPLQNGRRCELRRRARYKTVRQRYFDTAFRYTCDTTMLWWGVFITAQRCSRNRLFGFGRCGRTGRSTSRGGGGLQGGEFVLLADGDLGSILHIISNANNSQIHLRPTNETICKSIE